MTWLEVLDAALMLSERDFLALLCDLLIVRHEREETERRRHESMCGDIPYDDFLEDDSYDLASPVIPMTPKRSRARKR